MWFIVYIFKVFLTNVPSRGRSTPCSVRNGKKRGFGRTWQQSIQNSTSRRLGFKFGFFMWPKAFCCRWPTFWKGAIRTSTIPFVIERAATEQSKSSFHEMTDHLMVKLLNELFMHVPLCHIFECGVLYVIVFVSLIAVLILASVLYWRCLCLVFSLLCL